MREYLMTALIGVFKALANLPGVKGHPYEMHMSVGDADDTTEYKGTLLIIGPFYIVLAGSAEARKALDF